MSLLKGKVVGQESIRANLISFLPPLMMNSAFFYNKLRCQKMAVKLLWRKAYKFRLTENIKKKRSQHCQWHLNCADLYLKICTWLHAYKRASWQFGSKCFLESISFPKKIEKLMLVVSPLPRIQISVSSVLLKTRWEANLFAPTFWTIVN